jgi:hypothetical protein
MECDETRAMERAEGSPSPCGRESRQHTVDQCWASPGKFVEFGNLEARFPTFELVGCALASRRNNNWFVQFSRVETSSPVLASCF